MDPFSHELACYVSERVNPTSGVTGPDTVSRSAGVPLGSQVSEQPWHVIHQLDSSEQI